MKTMLIILGVFAAIVLVIILGLKIKPTPFAEFPQQSGKVDTVPLPSGLPKPVDRFYRAFYQGDQIPVINSVVMTGRAVIKPFMNIPLESRFRFTHDAGQGYRHYFEATFFNIPFFIVNEHFVDGKSFFELPFGITQTGPKTNQAANLGMWAELLNVPAVYLTDPRVHWEEVDDNNALLVVPFEDSQEHFMVRFDPETGLVKYTEIMRYQSEDSKSKSMWITESVDENTGSAMWLQDGRPWAYFTTEDMKYNVDINEYLRANGE